MKYVLSNSESRTHSSNIEVPQLMLEVECPVCYISIEDYILPLEPCGHRIHTECIIKSGKAKCPLCRESICNLTENQLYRLHQENHRLNQAFIGENVEFILDELLHTIESRVGGEDHPDELLYLSIIHRMLVIASVMLDMNRYSLIEDLEQWTIHLTIINPRDVSIKVVSHGESPSFEALLCKIKDSIGIPRLLGIRPYI